MRFCNGSSLPPRSGIFLLGGEQLGGQHFVFYTDARRLPSPPDASLEFCDTVYWLDLALGFLQTPHSGGTHALAAFLIVGGAARLRLYYLGCTRRREFQGYLNYGDRRTRVGP